jgi:hypothetical protein
MTAFLLFGLAGPEVQHRRNDEAASLETGFVRPIDRAFRCLFDNEEDQFATFSLSR